MNRHAWILLCLGVLLLGSIGGIAWLGDLGERTRPMLLLWGAAHLAYLAAARSVLRRESAAAAPDSLTAGRHTFPIVLAVGIAARILLLPSAPTLSEDLYRYLWDGRLVAHGVNPYLHAPSWPGFTERFHGELFHRLNHPDVPTIYPPAAQLLFGAMALVSATPAAWKLLLLALEGALVLALHRLLRGRGLPSVRLLLYYWNPLVLVESFGSGHVDLVAAAFLTVSIALYEGKRPARAGVAFALAVLTKYVPGLLIPWLVRRRAWALLATAAVTAGVFLAPFLAAGPALTTGLEIYARHWEFNGALYRLLREAIDSEIRVRLLLACAGLWVALAIAWKARSASAAAFCSMVSFLLLSPTVFPWYVVPAVAFLPLHPDRGMLAFSGLVALSYLPLPVYRETGVWALPGWILCVEYGGLFAVWAAGITKAVRRGGSSVEGGPGSGTRVRVEEREHSHVEKSEEVQREKR